MNVLFCKNAWHLINLYPIVVGFVYSLIFCTAVGLRVGAFSQGGEHNWCLIITLGHLENYISFVCGKWRQNIVLVREGALSSWPLRLFSLVNLLHSNQDLIKTSFNYRWKIFAFLSKHPAASRACLSLLVKSG